MWVSEHHETSTNDNTSCHKSNGKHGCVRPNKKKEKTTCAPEVGSWFDVSVRDARVGDSSVVSLCGRTAPEENQEERMNSKNEFLSTQNTRPLMISF